MDAWNTLIDTYLSPENPVLEITAKSFTDAPVTTALAQQLEQQWRSMTDVHQFFKILQKEK